MHKSHVNIEQQTLDLIRGWLVDAKVLLEKPVPLFQHGEVLLRVRTQVGMALQVVERLQHPNVEATRSRTKTGAKPGKSVLRPSRSRSAKPSLAKPRKPAGQPRVKSGSLPNAHPDLCFHDDTYYDKMRMAIVCEDCGEEVG